MSLSSLISARRGARREVLGAFDGTDVRCVALSPFRFEWTEVSDGMSHTDLVS
jgi:hypothetical protein